MTKIKRIVLSGFRGILTKQELDLTNSGGKPTSLVVYGLNSSGKTSFVDGLEWFLSPNSEIEWLKREDAGRHSYPHQASKNGKTFVQIDYTDKKYGSLTKTFNQQRITKPFLSDEKTFNELYQVFTIRPYLRYLEIIDFVFNRTGVEKYQKLASWMGFEEELAFQEKLALEILPNLRKILQELQNQIEYTNDEIKKLTELDKTDGVSLIQYCNSLLKQVGALEISGLKDLPVKIKELDIKRTGGNDSKIAIITKVQTFLDIFKVNDQLVVKLKKLAKQLDKFSKKKKLAEKIDYISLYEKAYSIIENQSDQNVVCPVCNTSWKKNKLTQHIKDELELLTEVKSAHDDIIQEIEETKSEIENEAEAINSIQTALQPAKDIDIDIKHSNLSLYKLLLDNLSKSFEGSIFEAEIKTIEIRSTQKKVVTEIGTLIKQLKEEKKSLEPSKEEVLFNEVTEKMRLLKDELKRRKSFTEKQKLYSKEIDKVTAIFDEFYRVVQDNITKRFKDISSTIEKYFRILRQDKKIKDIEITLNLEKAKAVGRSAEIQLSYYNLVVKPAYKVLSESLLNSLGLAVYFTCIKKFNTNAKFIVLDDVMNSLDVGHRDTLLDLIQDEFSDYQLVLFTHDMHWFERIQRRFPSWLHKKIKSWDYITGPKIDYSKTSIDEINELLKDFTKAHEAGRNLGIYVENILNELCEKLHAELRYRYTRHEPPSTDELFTALTKRLKNKLSKNPVVDLARNAYKYEPLIRNATSHSRQNYSSQISTQEVKRALDEWMKLENALWCTSCNKFVEYKRDRNEIECKCGQIKLEKVNN